MKAVAFAVVFLLFMVVTLLVPMFPPAQLLLETLGVQRLELSISGIPIAILLNGVANGFFWLAVAAIAYGLYDLIHSAQRSVPISSIPEPPKLPTPPLESSLVDFKSSIIPPARTIRAKPVRKEIVRVVRIKGRPVEKEQDIGTIEGIDPIYRIPLRNSGISTVNDLLRVGKKERGRRKLAKKIDVSCETLLKWVCQGDLQRVRGVGKKYSMLLESAGVNTVSDLSTEDPRYLLSCLRAINKEKNIVTKIPPPKTIESWVSNARTLKPIVE
jgi:predicted flap endonuclease-1-like 5' DNA nuclease